MQATGNIQPTTEVEVSSERSGVIRSVNVKANSVVKKGDVLAELDTERLQAELARDRAALMASAEGRLAGTKIDWREGARHFLTWLTDGDVANNNLNWQWTAGTGTDTNPNRIFNPTVQGQRFDPDGVYVRRYVEELATVPGGGAVQLWPSAGVLLSEESTVRCWGTAASRLGWHSWHASEGGPP